MGIFWKPKDEANKGATVQSTQPAPVPYIPPVPVSVSSEDFTVFHTQLTDALEAANMQNVQDYMDLKKALQNMASLPMDENTKFLAAFATMQTAGVDAQTFLESFDYYNNVVDGEKNKFDEAIQAALSEAVLDKQKTIERLSKQNETNTAEISRLTSEIASNNQQITTLQVEVSTDNAKLDQKKANFAAAYNKVKAEIQSDLVKAQQHIGTLPPSPVTRASKSQPKKTSKKEK
jgi:predicted nuclease with TOPRIM domain